MKVDFIPIVKLVNGVSLATEQVKEDILSAFHQRSHEILQDGFVTKNYHEFAINSIQSYLRNLSGFGKWVSRIDRKLLNGMLLSLKYNKKRLLIMQNFIECEAHRELILAGLRRLVLGNGK